MASVRFPPGWVQLIPGLLAVSVLVVVAASEGGYPATTWYPAALFLTGLLVATGLGLRARISALPRPTLLALGLLAAFTLWSFASIAWADVPGDAWDGANRTLLYLVVFALFALPRWRVGPAAVVSATYSVAIAVVAGVVLIDAATSSEPGLLLIDGRLANPTGYQNATAALFVGAVWIPFFLAGRRETPWPLRGPLLAAAGLALQVAILPESRGATIVFPIAAAIYLIVVPGRLRTLITGIPLAAATALAAGPLLDVFDVAQAGGDLAAAFDDALTAVAISAAGLLLAGTAIALVDRRLRIGERVARGSERAASFGLAGAAIAGLVVFVVAVGNPVDWADQRWQNFKSGYSAEQFGSSRLGGDLGSNRYDFWRVGLGTSFAGSPLTGTGADNFAVDYVAERQSSEEPKYPHSLPVRLLGGTGLIGALLFGGFLVAAGVAALGAARRAPPASLARGLVAALAVAVAYWIGHASGDWLYSFAGITAPAFAWLALAGRIEPEPEPAKAAPASSERRWWLWPATIAVLLLAAATLLLPYAAAREYQRAIDVWRADPALAIDRLDRAADLNFLSADPDLLAGTIATRLRDREAASTSFEAALERDPNSWYALLELGAIDSLEGNHKRAVQRLRRARALDPADPLIVSSLRTVRNGGRVTLGSLERALLARVCERIGRTGSTRFCA